MVRLSVALQAATRRDAGNLLETLRFLATTTRHEPGCQQCSAWVDPELMVHYGESWASEADVRRRVRSQNFTSLLALMECASAPPDVEFDFISNTRGLDFIAEVRGEGEFDDQIPA